MIEAEDILYPDSDGIPMSDNTWQHRWIATLMWNASLLFQDRHDVFVAGDHLIYPVQGQPTIRIAPDAYIGFGAVKKDRGSYKVWKEGDIFPQVVFEVYSPGNSQVGFDEKRDKYEQFGAEEFYVIHPDFPCRFVGYVRSGNKLVEVESMNGHVSPRLGISFIIDEGDIEIRGPDGNEWLPPDKLAAELTEERDAARKQASTERRKASTATRRAEANERRAEAADAKAAAETRRADAEKQRADEAMAKAEALRAKLRSLGIDPE